MNYKQICGLLVAAIGVAGIFTARYYGEVVSQKASEAHQQVKQATGNIPDNTVGNIVGGQITKSANKKIAAAVDQYTGQLAWLMRGSIALVVVGGVVLLLGGDGRKKR